MRRRVWLAASFLPMALGWVSAVWFLTANPLAWTVLERGAAALRQDLDRQITRALDSGDLNTALSEAVADQDAVRATTLLDLAETRQVAVDPATLAAARALTGADRPWWTVASDCAHCAVSLTTCRSLTEITLCAVPVELSPIGDVTAISRAGMAYAAGEEIDKLDMSLGLVGLAATGAVLVSGGSSLTVKAGASAVRMARRLGSLTPGLRQSLGRAADLPIQWSKLDDLMVGRVGLEAVTDVARLDALALMAADSGRIVRATSAADGLILLRHADDPADLARIARVAEAGGDQTRDAFALMGKARVFRMLKRVSVLTATVLGLLFGLVLQIGVMILTRLLRSVIRAAARQAT